MHALIATDGSDVSVDAARKAVALLRPTKVTLLSVADTSIADDSGAGGFEVNLLSPAESERDRQAILAEGDDEVDATLDAIGLDPSIVEHRVVEGSAGPMICQVAEDLSPDVVVVGSHGRGWFKRVVIGSVSEHVARHCAAPVLVVRHDDATESGSDGSPGGDA